MTTPILIIFLCCCMLQHHGTIVAREADERSRFIYADDPSATIILEYQLHNAPSRDYAGDEQKKASREQPGSEYDEERHIKPYFLTPENGPRVVQYYSPWCGHCQHFKTKYVALAKEINARLPDDQPEINFHAVSCSVYHWICMRNNVKGFPTIVAFRANSAVPELLKEKKMTAESIAKIVGVRLNAPTRDTSTYQTEEGNSDFPAVDILGASLNGMTRTRDAVYRDAALSFTHALKTEIFYKDDDGETAYALDPVQREVFSDWINLLYWALPPTWILHTLINDIRNNIDSVLVSEENLIFMVEKHQDVVNGANNKWTHQCSKSDNRSGYSCGLWSLFHIISIGVVQRHKAVLGGRDQVSTMFVAETMRNYIEQFFHCEECKDYFINMFDNCGFKHCKRFKQKKRLPSPESWNEFPLWLWEVHNDVNSRITEADLKRAGGYSTHKLDLAAWPPASECPLCKKESGKWDKDAILDHLKKEYWPRGIQNFRFVVLKRNDGKDKDDDFGILQFLFGLLENFFFLITAVVAVIWCCSRGQLLSLLGRRKNSNRRRASYHDE